MQAIVLEGGSGRSVGLPVLCPAVTIPQRWCVLCSVCKAASVRMGPTYTKTDVSPSRSVLVLLVSISLPFLKSFVKFHPFILSSSLDPCAYTDCAPGYECLVYEATGEAYCSPNCEELNPCAPDELCVLTTVYCVRAPCPPILSCQGIHVHKVMCYYVCSM